MNDEAANSIDLVRVVDHFWMSPADLRILEVMRRLFGVIIILKVALLWPDRHLFFGSGGYLPPDAAKKALDQDAWNLYSFAPDSPWTITVALSLLIVTGVAMVIGKGTRIAAIVAFLLLVAVDHANNLIIDGEDTVIRLFAFYFIFAPSWRQLKQARCNSEAAGAAESFPIWPLRLFQIQVCLIFLATAIHKSNGAEWLDGTALYFILRLDDFTRFHLPEWATDSLFLIKVATWGVLMFEFALPLLIWLPRLRWPCLIVAFVFHLATDYAMNLHLFHWVMLIGWLAFVRFEDVERLFSFLRYRRRSRE